MVYPVVSQARRNNVCGARLCFRDRSLSCSSQNVSSNVCALYPAKIPYPFSTLLYTLTGSAKGLSSVVLWRRALLEMSVIILTYVADLEPDYALQARLNRKVKGRYLNFVGFTVEQGIAEERLGTCERLHALGDGIFNPVVGDNGWISRRKIQIASTRPARGNDANLISVFLRRADPESEG